MMMRAFAGAFLLPLLSGPLRAQSGGAASAGPPSGQSATSDPTGALSLFDAVSKQLGLKLEKQRRPAPVLIIDLIEETPTEN
jgi:uncharacterized protein (TIGR03435 family)